MSKKTRERQVYPRGVSARRAHDLENAQVSLTAEIFCCAMRHSDFWETSGGQPRPRWKKRLPVNTPPPSREGRFPLTRSGADALFRAARCPVGTYNLNTVVRNTSNQWLERCRRSVFFWQQFILGHCRSFDRRTWVHWRPAFKPALSTVRRTHLRTRSRTEDACAIVAATASGTSSLRRQAALSLSISQY